MHAEGGRHQVAAALEGTVADDINGQGELERREARATIETVFAYLVECAGSDKIWACGVRLDDKERHDASKWKGTNLLGFALMEVREIIRN